MEQIIKVDLNDNEIGFVEKLQAHRKPILHRAFSVFLYHNNKILIQKRAFDKYHSGGLWANSCCSHPRANKTFMQSVYERLDFELGIAENIPLQEIFSFVYYSKYNDDLFEYEYDHVLIGEFAEQEINYNKDEIFETKWVDVEFLKEDLVKNPQNYATWFLICAPRVIDFLQNNQH